MSETESSGGGLLGSARRLLITLLALVQNRIEIFGIELQEEKCRLVEVLLWGAIAIILAALAVITLSLGLVIILWEYTILRNVCMIVLGLIYIIGAWIAFRQVTKKLRDENKPFEETIKALSKDLSCLNTQD